MNYVGKQLNSINHTKLYLSIYRQCSICPLSQKNYKIWLRFHKAISIYNKANGNLQFLGHPVFYTGWLYSPNDRVKWNRFHMRCAMSCVAWRVNVLTGTSCDSLWLAHWWRWLHWNETRTAAHLETTLRLFQFFVRADCNASSRTARDLIT